VVVNVGKLLERALFHDIEEVITGDMPRPHKHSNPQLALLMEQSAMTCAKEVFTRIELDDEDTIELFDGWNTAKSDGYEGRILSFADFLSAISFIFQEVQGGNRTIEKHISSCREYTNTFKSARYDFIAPLVLQTEALMDEVFSTFSVGKR
jgi:5'-deoxynucleotidase